MNSVRSLLDDAGFPLGTASYDAWGQPETPLIAPFGFTGEVQQGNDVWLRARWYGAGRGAFASRDPYAGDAQMPYSMMPYQYAYSAPTVWTDASGRCVEGDGDSPQRCRQVLQDIAAHGISLQPAHTWRLVDRMKVLDAIRDIRNGTGWSQALFRSAMTGFDQYRVTMMSDTKPATGYVDPNQSDGVIKVHVGIDIHDLLARYTIVHELAHVWDNALGHDLSDGLVRSTGGYNTEGIVKTDNFRNCSDLGLKHVPIYA